MQLKVGTAYKARNGKREEIVGNDGHIRYPFYGESGRSYMTNGRECKAKRSEHDLIAEWQDAPEVGKWIGWNGGECPVHPETVVEVVGGWDQPWTTKAHHKHVGWENVIAYRIITPYVEPQAREFWVLHGVDGMKDCVSDTPIKSPLAIHVSEVLPDDE